MKDWNNIATELKIDRGIERGKYANNSVRHLMVRIEFISYLYMTTFLHYNIMNKTFHVFSHLPSPHIVEQ